MESTSICFGQVIPIVNDDGNFHVPFPTGQVPEEGKVLTRSKKTEGIEVPMAVLDVYKRQGNPQGNYWIKHQFPLQVL